MHLKRALLLSLLLICGSICRAQKIYDIAVIASKHKDKVRSLELSTDKFTLCVDPKGEIYVKPAASNDYSYYTHADGAYREGKIRSVGGVQIDYYNDISNDYNGKIKSAGDIQIVYYDRFGDSDKLGWVKLIGNLAFDYYDRYDGPDNRGKLKQIGTNTITYQDRYDGNENFGKIKSLGKINISYFDRFDGEGLQGRVKQVSGQTQQLHLVM